MKVIIAAAVAALMPIATAAHADNATFVELGGGLGEIHAGSFHFINPGGAAYLSSLPSPAIGESAVRGNQILLDRQRRDASSPTAEVTLGRFLGRDVYIRATYRYLGQYHLSGSAAFPIDPSTPALGSLGFDQDYSLRGNAGYLGLGYQRDVAGSFFLGASGEAGAAVWHSVSRQGANIGDPLGHPPRSRTTFSAGGELVAGAHLTPHLDLLFKAHADWLGRAQTGVVPADTISADGNWGINAGEQLRLARLFGYGLGASLRARF